MTDNDIKKALECCTSEKFNSCKDCPFVARCGEGNETIHQHTLALINRQKAEIERLSSDRYLLKEDGTMTLLPRTDVTKIKAEAIKEFRGRLWKKLCTRVTLSFVFDFIRFVEEEMEKEMKEEMVGETNGNDLQ